MRHPRSRQHGMALVVALLFLLMLTLLGVASFSTNTVEERMGYANADYARAFQAADSAVSQGENWLLSQTSAPDTCDSGCLVLVTAPALTSLVSAQWWSNNGVVFNTIPNQDGSSAGNRSDINMGRIPTTQYPKYSLQYVGKGLGSLGIGGAPPPPISHYYHVNGNGTGVLPQMQAVTQSTYAKEF